MPELTMVKFQRELTSHFCGRLGYNETSTVGSKWSKGFVAKVATREKGMFVLVQRIKVAVVDYHHFCRISAIVTADVVCSTATGSSCC